MLDKEDLVNEDERLVTFEYHYEYSYEYAARSRRERRPGMNPADSNEGQEFKGDGGGTRV